MDVQEALSNTRMVPRVGAHTSMPAQSARIFQKSIALSTQESSGVGEDSIYSTWLYLEMHKNSLCSINIRASKLQTQAVGPGPSLLNLEHFSNVSAP
jgi:hypothetical protein